MLSLAQSDAPFLSTTVAPMHPVELFRYLLDTQDWQHIFCHDQRSHNQWQFQATLLPLVRNAHALDPSTQRNDGISFCTLHVPSTRVRRFVLHWVQEEDLAPSAPLPRPNTHHLQLDHVLLLELVDLVLLLELLDLDSPVLQVRTRPATPRF